MSSIMSVSPQLRPACGGTVALPTLGGCWQQQDAADSTTKIKYNRTQILNYTNSGQTYIDPFAVANLTTEACSPYSTTSYPIFVCGTGPTGAGANGNLWCYPIPASYMHGSGSNTVSFSVGGYNNFYSQSNDTASNPCGDNRALGFKNVYAKKTWSGKKAYTSPDYGKPDDWDWCCAGCQRLENRPSADTTKYLTLSANASYQIDNDVLGDPVVTPITYYDCSDPPVEVDGNCTDYPDEHITTLIGTATATTTISKYGQIVTANCTSASSGNFSEGCAGDPDCIAYEQNYFANTALGLLGKANGTWVDLLTAYCSVVAASNAGTPTTITHLGAGSWYVTYNQMGMNGTQVHCGPPITPTSMLATELTISPTSLVIKEYGQRIISPRCDGGDVIYSWEKWHESTWSFGDTTFSFDDVAQENTVSLNWQRLITQHVDGTLSNPYTAQEVYDDLVNNLLSEWDMGKDMPWRTDTRKTVGPMVSRQETTNYPYIGNCQLTTSQWTGDILGAPAPEGIDRVWDVNHANYCTCPDEYLPENISFYLQDYGAWSTDGVKGCGVPRATQWTNFWESNNFPDGAFIGSNIIWTFPASAYGPAPAIVADDTLYACKYAESIFSKQSFNYARPCGADRLQISQSTNRCIASIAGDVLTLEPTSPTNLIASGSKVWVAGTAGLDGMWNVGSSVAHSITLHEPRIASASQFPTNPVDNGGTGVVYQLRWGNLTDTICGRIGIVAVTSASNSGAVTASLDTPSYLVNGDSVTVIGNPSLNGTHTITVIDNATIILNGTSGGATAGGQIYSPFGADWKWNDTSTKGDFVAKSWQSEFRSLGEYNRIVSQNAANSVPYSGNCNAPTSPCGYYATVPPVVRPEQLACGLDQNWVEMKCDTQCLPVGICGAAAAYFSPSNNTESFVGPSKNLGWSSPVAMDSVYGGFYWQGIIQQSMDDPYFVTPPCRCEYFKDCNTEVVSHECISSWIEDNGSCQTDVEPVQDCDVPELSVTGQRYYASRNQFEARCSIPTGAPPLVGINLGCLTTAQANAGQCNGNVCPAPYAPNTFPQEEGSQTCNPYLVRIASDPWVLMTTKEGCVCNDGRFSSNYSANGIGIGPTCTEFPI